MKQQSSDPKSKSIKKKPDPVDQKPLNIKGIKDIKGQSPTLLNRQSKLNSSRTKQHPNQIRHHLPKVNSIMVLNRPGNDKSPRRPLSGEHTQKKPVFSKSIQKDKMVNRNIPSKSIAPTVKKGDTEVLRPAISTKDMGMVYLNPQHDSLSLESLQTTDPIFQKYFDMVSNDNDAIFVLNALPQLKSFKNEIQQNKLDFVLSNRLSRISGQFNQLTPQKIITILKTKPTYFDSKLKVVNSKLQLETKYKVKVDVGFVQYLVEADRVVVTRFYLSRIYRKMNYLAYSYCQVMKHLLETHGGIDKVSMFMHDRNTPCTKFMKAIGCRIQRILTDSSNQKVDYYQEFMLRRKELLGAQDRLGICK